MKPPTLLAVSLLLTCLAAAQNTHTYVGHYLVPFPGPATYTDPISRTLFYVESDGRHVAAISKDGKLLWNRDPFADAHAPFYRTDKPQIVFIGPASNSDPVIRGKHERFVAITFNNSQFGVLKISDGDFVLEGQD
ncbi:MAG: hypothetical protein ACLQG3_13215 [Terracidiphilus sp.]|jgi:hypothetical protein